MSLAYYIVLDQPEPGFDPFVNGKFVAAEARRVSKVAKRLGLKRLDDFVSYDDEQPTAELSGVETGGDRWFSAAEGVAWVSELLDRLRSDPKRLRNPAGVISDLEEYLEVLRKAQSVGAHWHFAIDY